MVWFQLVWKLLVIFHRTTASSAGFSLHYYHFLFWSFWLRQLPTGVCVCVCVCVCFLLIFFLTSNYLKQTNINKYILKSTHQLPKKKKKNKLKLLIFLRLDPSFLGRSRCWPSSRTRFFLDVKWTGQGHGHVLWPECLKRHGPIKSN